MGAEPRTAGTRLIVVSDDLLEFIGTRSDRGDRLSFEWGEPDRVGVYTPTVTTHADDNLLAAYKAELAEKVRALPVAWYGAHPNAVNRNAVLALLEAEPPQTAQEGIALPPDGDSDWRQDELPGSY